MVDALILLDAFGLLPTDSVWTIPITKITEELWFECFDFPYVNVELIALLKFLNTKQIPVLCLYWVNGYLYWWAGGTLQVSHSDTVAFKFCSSDNLQTCGENVWCHIKVCLCFLLYFFPTTLSLFLQAEISKVMRQGVDELLKFEKKAEKKRVYAYEKAFERYWHSSSAVIYK